MNEIDLYKTAQKDLKKKFHKKIYDSILDTIREDPMISRATLRKEICTRFSINDSQYYEIIKEYSNKK